MSKELASKVAMTEDSPTVKDMATKVPSQSYRIPVAFFLFHKTATPTQAAPDRHHDNHFDSKRIVFINFLLKYLYFMEIWGQRIFPVGSRRCRSIVLSLQNMKPDQLLRAILPDVLIDNFDIDRFEKSDTRFDIWLDEKKEQLREDKYNNDIISYGFGDYRTIQDYPIRGRATYLHVRKRKWLDKATGEIFSYEWDISEFDGTRLNAEFVAFLKEGD